MTLANAYVRRRAAAVPLTLLLLVPLLGMVAFAVDVGWMVATKTDLQNAADAAALAGTGTLMDPHVQYHLPGQKQAAKDKIKTAAIAAARAKAKTYAAHNSAGGAASLYLRDEDVEFGFTDAKGKYTAIPSYSGFPNTVRVTLRRDDTANKPLGLFFGGVLGTPSANLTASAAASTYVTDINSFPAAPPTPIRLLPMTYDAAHWDQFLATGTNPDGTATTDGSGYPTLKVYTSTKFTGNFGLLSLDDSSNGASKIRSWIDIGITKTEIATLTQQKLIPLSSHDQTKWDWKGVSGNRQSNVNDLGDHIGESYLLPLYKAYHSDSTGKKYAAGTGQGSNYHYNIVRFVPVKIVSTGQATVIVQPAAMLVDPRTVISSTTPVPAGTGTASQVVFLPPKLSQ